MEFEISAEKVYGREGKFILADIFQKKNDENSNDFFVMSISH